MLFSKSKRINSALYNANIFTYRDIIFHLPYRYEDYSLIDESKTLIDKQKVCLLVKVISINNFKKTKNVSIFCFDSISSSNKTYRVICFNRDYLTKIVEINGIYTIYGQYNLKKNQIELINIYKGKIKDEDKIKPIYHLPKEIKNFEFSRLVKKAFDNYGGKIFTLVPFYFLNKHHLLNKLDALKLAHFPTSKADVKNALLFLKYEEAFIFSMKNLIERNEIKNNFKKHLDGIDFHKLKPFIDGLHFKLSDDQNKALICIENDLNSSKEMYRLVEGDVGSGKTIVAFLTLIMNYLRNRQGVLLAPTEVLALQHYQNFINFFSQFKLNVKLLTGSTKNEERHIILEDLKEGLIDILIGTHSLFTKEVKYNCLSLAIIDEQHRFGVNQRREILSKGNSVDLLMMSATPIPRSLALTIFGDLDISIISSYPGRGRNVTTIMEMVNMKTIFNYIDHEIINNKKVYIVCPLIEYDENKQYSLESIYPLYFKQYKDKVIAMHGKMKSEDKLKAIEDFKSGRKPILISTQVIEVGIDVMDASLMIIYKASMFGLASLHQLRGRIGRDNNKATCVLLFDKDDDIEALKRLKQLENISDGFQLSELDLKNRGPGELLGIKQSGLPDFSYLNIANDLNIFKIARDDTNYLLSSYKENENFKYTLEMIKKQMEYEERKKA